MCLRLFNHQIDFIKSPSSGKEQLHLCFFFLFAFSVLNILITNIEVEEVEIIKLFIAFLFHPEIPRLLASNINIVRR